MTTFQRIIKYCAVAFAVFLIVSIVGGICGGLGMVFGLSGRSAVGEMQSYAVSSDIESMDLEISAAELKIISGDSFSVESNHKYLTVEEDDGTLKISEKKADFGAASEGVTVVLTVPDGFVFEDASIETGADKLELTGQLTGSCEVDFGVGDADLTLLGSREDYQIKLDKGVGGATLNGKTMSDDSVYGGGENRIDIDGGVGSIHIQVQEEQA